MQGVEEERPQTCPHGHFEDRDDETTQQMAGESLTE